jgi:Flp pilus assembly protein TadD
MRRVRLPPGFSSENAIAVGLSALTLAVYWSVGSHPFIGFDDPLYLTENPAVRDGLTLAGIRWAFTAFNVSNWHPLTWISHMADVSLFGMNAGGHHMVSLLIHIVNTLLLLRILRKMTGRLPESALVAALFALHPLHVESVAWAAERKDVLCALFWFLSIGAYARYSERPTVPRYLAVVLFFASALLSKPMAVTLPFVLLLLDYWPLARIGGHAFAGIPVQRASASRLAVEKLPLLLLSAGSCILTWYAQHGHGSVILTIEFPPGERVANALASYGTYLFHAAWPSGLSVFYPHPGKSLPAWRVAVCSLGLAVATVYALRAARRRPWLPVGWFWFLGTLIPVIGLVQVGGQAMADRYTYLPLIGIFIALSWELSRVVSDGKLSGRSAVAGACACILALSLATWRQVGYWRGNGVLFAHAIEVTGDNWMAHLMLGMEAARQGNGELALSHYQAMLKIQPGYADGHYGAYTVLDSLGRREEALSHYTSGLRARAVDPVEAVRAGLSFAESGKLEEGIACFREALRLKPDYPEAHYNLGIALARLGRRDESLPHFRAALAMPLADADAHNRVGVALLRLGRIDESIVRFREAVRLKPGHEEARYNLAVALGRIGKKDESIATLRAILKDHPGDEDAQNELKRAGGD